MEENFDIPVDNEESFDELLHYGTKIGRASCRERVFITV